MSTRAELIIRICHRLVIALVGLLILTVAAFPIARQWKGILAATPALSVIAGAIGGFVSVQKRLKLLPDEDLQLLASSWFYALLSPFVGGILGLLLYILFLSGLLAGDLFPHFIADVPPLDNPVPLQGFDQIFATHGESHKDYAKMLFWAFIAGYSERFVVDVINRFQEQASDSK